MNADNAEKASHSRVGKIFKNKKVIFLILMAIVVLCITIFFVYTKFISDKQDDNPNVAQQEKCVVLDDPVVNDVKSGKTSYAQIKSSINVSNLCSFQNKQGYEGLSAEKVIDQYTVSKKLALESYAAGDKSIAASFANNALASSTAMVTIDRQTYAPISDLRTLNSIVNGTYEVN